MTIWTKEKCDFLKDNWGKATARELAEQMGPGFTRNSIIGKASRLGLSAKIKTRTATSNKNFESSIEVNKIKSRRTRKNKFRSLLIDKNFEQAKNLSLEELTDTTCKYMEGHPDQKDSSFCGRKTVEKYSYCPLHMLIVWQTRDRKDDLLDKEEEVPKFIEKKIKSA